jgi:fructuronate reductase
MTSTMPQFLTRRNGDSSRSTPPARIVHFGLGSFHRAHQAWFTAHASDAERWGICAFTGHSAGIATALRGQGGLYTLVVRSASEDQFEVMTNLVEIHDGADSLALIDAVSRPEISVITTTVTEAGYRMDLDGAPHDGDTELDHDIDVLREVGRATHLGAPQLITVPGRLLLGLEARRRAGAGPLTIVPCDNLPRNGWVLGRGLHRLAQLASPRLDEWMYDNVSFASSSVDRITPRTTPEDVRTVRFATGWIDAAPVVTEPFASWVIAGDFPAGRPHWESAGALFVRDIEPYEKRKLWLLNGAHSLLALLGLSTGHRTVDQAIHDPQCRQWVESFWHSARRHLDADLGIDAYCGQLIERFENPRIGYELEQIASDSVMKLRTRIAPVIVAELRAGRSCPAGTEVLSAWVRRVREGLSSTDAEAPALNAILTSSLTPSKDLVTLVEPRLGDFGDFVDDVVRLVDARGVASTAPKTTPPDLRP